MNLTKWEKDWLLTGFLREYEIHNIDNFETEEEANTYITEVKELEKKIKDIKTID